MSDFRIETDQMGREVAFSFPPLRIISLVPSQTEFLMDIGAPVVGRTKFCVHPADKVKNIPIVGGTKKFRYEAIADLKPDLIIGNKEENYKSGIDFLQKIYPVWMSDIVTLNDAFDMMNTLGAMVDKRHQANQVRKSCLLALSKVKDTCKDKVIYLIWREPWMAAGGETFIDHILSFLGYQNLIKASRYPEISNEEIKSLKPEKILLSSEPYPFKSKHIKEIQSLFPDVECTLVNGELYSWYGSRLRFWA